jgi:hypothetical protein
MTNPITAVIVTDKTNLDMPAWKPVLTRFDVERTSSQLRYESGKGTMSLVVWASLDREQGASFEVQMRGVTCYADESSMTFEGFTRNYNGSSTPKRIVVGFVPISEDGVWE